MEVLVDRSPQPHSVYLVVTVFHVAIILLQGVPLFVLVSRDDSAIGTRKHVKRRICFVF